MALINTTGRRKTAIARAYVEPGTGVIDVNGKPYQEYFATKVQQYYIQQPFEIIGAANQYNVNVKVKGGGLSGQAEAIRLAISKALVEVSPEVKAALKIKGLMTRDPRMVERKKFGHKKARKSFQFSKR